MGTVKGSVAALKPITVSEYFRNAVGQWSSNIALKVKRGGQWVQYNYKQYWDNVMKTSKAFLKVRDVIHHLYNGYLINLSVLVTDWARA